MKGGWTGMERIIPENCERNVKIISDRVGCTGSTAMSMILMTAALMDLYPDDEHVVDIILKDIGLEPEPA